MDNQDYVIDGDRAWGSTHDALNWYRSQLAIEQSRKCKTCAYWQEPDTGDNRMRNADEICEPTDPDTYEPMVMPFVVKLCRHPKQTFAERPVEQNGFGVVDGSEYYARLITAEDFGCLRHERKKDD